MKRVATKVLWVAFGVTLIAEAVIGVKLLDGNYDFLIEAYIAAAGFFTIFICSLLRAFGNKCPNCGKTMLDHGEYCSYCGKKIDTSRPEKR